MMYTKTTLVEMERFDSLTVARKYHLRYQAYDDSNSITAYFLKIPGGYASINLGDWIETDLNGAHEVVTDEVFRKAYRPVEVSNLNNPNDD